jgi:hypothetical protein
MIWVMRESLLISGCRTRESVKSCKTVCQSFRDFWFCCAMIYSNDLGKIIILVGNELNSSESTLE